MGAILKAKTVLIVASVVVLGAITIATGYLMQQSRNRNISPIEPESKPEAAALTTDWVCRKEYKVEALKCGDSGCVNNAQCGGGNVCYQGRCVVEICKDKPDVCACTGEAKCKSKQAYKDTRLEPIDSVNLSLLPELATNSEVEVGSYVLYRVNYANIDSSLEARGVRVVDTLPRGVTLVAMSTGCTVNGMEVTCNMGTVKPGAGGYVLIRVRVTEGVSLMNTAEAMGGVTMSPGIVCSHTLKVKSLVTPTPTLTLTPTPTKKLTPTPTPTTSVAGSCVVQGKKFNDVNGNGVFDGSDNMTGVTNWQLVLTRLDTGTTWVAITRNEGLPGWPNSYRFTGLMCGVKYKLQEGGRQGWNPTGIQGAREEDVVSYKTDAQGNRYSMVEFLADETPITYLFGNKAGTITPMPTSATGVCPYVVRFSPYNWPALPKPWAKGWNNRGTDTMTLVSGGPANYHYKIEIPTWIENGAYHVVEEGDFRLNNGGSRVFRYPDELNWGLPDQYGTREIHVTVWADKGEGRCDFDWDRYFQRIFGAEAETVLESLAVDPNLANRYCIDSKPITTPRLNSRTRFICGGPVADGVTYEFRYKVNNGRYVKVGANSTGSNISVPVLMTAGSYRMECRVCYQATSKVCTSYLVSGTDKKRCGYSFSIK